MADNMSCYAEYGSGKDAEPVVLEGSPFTAQVKRPSKRQHDENAGLEEVLKVKLKLLRHQFYHFNLFINLPTASETTPIASCPQFASAFTHTPLAPSRDKEYETLFSVGIGDIITELGLSNQAHLLATFVPTGRFKNAPLTVESISIDLE